MSRDDDGRRELGGPESGELSGEAPDELEAGLLPLLDSGAGPARALSERERQLLVAQIERRFARSSRVLRWRRPRRVVLAGALSAASAAAAVYGVGVLNEEAATAPAPSSGERASEPPPQLPAEPAPVPPEPAPPESAPPEPAPSEAAPPPALDDEPLVAPEGARPAVSDAAAPKPSRSGTAQASGSRRAGADRLAVANALRARHRYREALDLYLRVIQLDPDGVQASVARVAAAEVQLDHFGDVAGAERLYREAKTQGGELMAEAQFGLAQVARARGDAAGERQALQDFLTRHPGSPLASAARRRLSALGAR